jgi:hypothetical protein
VTIGTTPLVIGKTTTIQVLVTNPAFIPVPNGQVALDFGDGSTADSLPISNTWVGTTHTYSAPGQFTITLLAAIQRPGQSCLAWYIPRMRRLQDKRPGSVCLSGRDRRNLREHLAARAE